MKKIVLILILMSALTCSLHAAIGWSGNIWPNSYTDQTNGLDITVYYQIWKDGVTNLPGSGDSLSAKIYYKTQTQTSFTSEMMTFNVDVYNNDEYTGVIPNSAFSTGDTIFFYCEGYDSTDGTYSYGTDQNNAGPFDDTNPGEYYIIAGLNQEVTVTFQVDMSVVDPVYTVSVAGSFNGWTAGIDTLSNNGDDVFVGDVVFAAGSNPVQEYKFVNGSNWEDQIGNRQVVIDDSSPTMILPVVYFNDITPNQVTVAFQVDMSVQIFNDYFVPGVDTISVSGSMNNWDTWELVDYNGDEVYAAEFSFFGDVGDIIEYKYRINDTYELDGMPNRNFTIDDTITATPIVYYDDLNPNPPLNFTATANNMEVLLEWDAPARRDVNYYNLYRDDSIFAIVYHPTTTYTDMSASQGIHLYYSTAVYPEGESLPSNLQIVFVGTNTPPVADAGIDQTVVEGDAVYLDGSGSYDPDGFPLSYNWSAPDGIILSDSTAVDPSFIAPTVNEDTEFIISLVVYDGSYYSDPDYITITVLNEFLPTADFVAFPVTGSVPLEVEFTDLSAPDITSWLWNFGDGETSTDPNPDHTYNSSGVFSVSLTVTNSFGTDTITKNNYIHVSAVPLPPPTNLTYLINVCDVLLDWDAPTTETRDVIYYKLYRDYNLIAVIYAPTTLFNDLNLPLGVYEYFVTAMYPEGESSPSGIVTVNIINNPPIADAGPDQTVDEGDIVQLDGSGSYDPEGLPLTYSWTAPPEIILDDPEIVNPSFIAPLVTEDEVFPIELMVYDGNSWSDPDTVFITVQEVMASGEEPQNFVTSLHTPYPNPFNSSTRISFSLKDYSTVNITVYNIKGAFVTTLANSSFGAGNHEIVWNRNEMCDGVYFVTLKVNNEITDIQKAIILR